MTNFFQGFLGFWTRTFTLTYKGTHQPSYSTPNRQTSPFPQVWSIPLHQPWVVTNVYNLVTSTNLGLSQMSIIWLPTPSSEKAVSCNWRALHSCLLSYMSQGLYDLNMYSYPCWWRFNWKWICYSSNNHHDSSTHVFILMDVVHNLIAHMIATSIWTQWTPRFVWQIITYFIW